jgi:2'-5' RNA ligase
MYKINYDLWEYYMQYAVMLYFDENTDNTIKKYIEKLEPLTNNKYMLDHNMPAHITLAMWNSEYDYSEKIKEYAQKSQTFDVAFESIGFFNRDERHIFLAPVKSDSLSALHDGLYEAINLPDEKDYIDIYKNNDIWVAHTTIAYQVNDGRFSETLAQSSKIKLPIVAKAKSLAIAVCCPFKELAAFPLCTGGELP